MELKVARNLDEYCEIIKNIKSSNEELWFRGMSNATFSLTPSLFREKRTIGINYSGREINGKYYRKSDAVMKSDLSAIETFINYYNEFFPEKCEEFNLIDYLYVMQHYEIPTRLLDFSRDELVALYFSVSSNNHVKCCDLQEEINEFNENYGHSEKGSSIHIIDPKFTNNNTNSFVNLKDYILNIDDITIDMLSKIVLPICIETKNQDSRIVLQKGVFLLYGSDYRAYDEYDIFKSKTKKIFIPNSCRNSIKNELKQKFKISHSSIYPDIKGISLELIDEIEDKYISDCKSIFG